MKIYFLCFLFAGIVHITNSQTSVSTPVSGAWHSKNEDTEHILIFIDGYFTFSSFDIKNKKFYRSFGGSFSVSGDQVHAQIEFDTEVKEQIGQHLHYRFKEEADVLSINISGVAAQWKRIDEGSGNLSGNWRITGRMQNGQMNTMQRGDRKTLKILSDTRFQWMAINPATKEFFGTGGGTYTFKDGKYTEHIEFFSRDSSRVGASLSFEGSVSGNVWTHKGLSSRGEPIHEEWTREKTN